MSVRSRELRSQSSLQSAGGANSGAALSAMREPDHLAPMAVFLCTDEAWNINGKIFAVSGGSIALLQEEVPMRTITKQEAWTLDELRGLVPARLMAGLPNPAPPPPELEIPGRPVEAGARR